MLVAMAAAWVGTAIRATIPVTTASTPDDPGSDVCSVDSSIGFDTDTSGLGDGGDSDAGDGGACFLTTAIVERRGIEADGGPTLTALRRFRDGYMMKTPKRRALVAEYYELAPRIVAAIPETTFGLGLDRRPHRRGHRGYRRGRRRRGVRDLCRHGAPPRGVLDGTGQPHGRRRKHHQRSTAMTRNSPLSLALAAMMATGLMADSVAAQAAPASPNYSSHAAGFFTGLLEGRVWILERPNSRRAGDRNTVWAHYHGPDGTLRACAHLGGAYAPGTARWRVVPSREFRALYNFNETGVAPDPGQRRGHTPIFYDPAAGVLHNEALGAASGAWAVASRGWVQESWPRAMKDACPDLALPADLPVNEKQTSAVFDEMAAQDLDAPVRGFPGSELRGPGATGIAASGGHATLPAAALKRFLEDNNGRVLIDNTGARHVLVLGPDRDELWLLDGSGGTSAIVRYRPSRPGGGRRGDRAPLRATAVEAAFPRRRRAAAAAHGRTVCRDAADRLAGGAGEPGHAALHGGQGFRVPLPGGRNSYRGIGRRQRQPRDGRCVALVARRTDRDPRWRGGGQQLSLARARRPSRVDARMTAATFPSRG